jgi:cell division septum initiation protein DivIVA
MTTTKDPMEKAKQTLDRLQEQNASLQKQIQAGSVLEAEYERLVDKHTKTAGRYDKLLMRVGDKHGKAHRVAVDMSGGSIAQVSTELINWGVRAIGRWSKDGFFASNVDLLQGGPHFFLGLGLYILEMATRKDPADNNGELPNTTREVLSEATKIFAQLGFNNVVRALRVRYVDGKRQALDYEALLAEKQALEQKLKSLGAAQPEKR